MTTDNTLPEIAANFTKLSPEDRILMSALVRRCADDSLGAADGARLAQLSDRDLRAVAFRFGVSLDALQWARGAGAREEPKSISLEPGDLPPLALASRRGLFLHCTRVSGQYSVLMADYREISQEYAKGGIKAAILINGAAAITLLSQIIELRDTEIAGGATSAMTLWAIGVAAATFAWIAGFISTRYVDKSEREAGRERENLWWSDAFMIASVLLIIFSLLCFSAGAGVLACSFSQTT